MRLKGRTAIVTGGASGFGEGIVRRFVQEGAQVAIVDLNLQAVWLLRSQDGGGASWVREEPCG
jgi:3-oxoacyl-[acyl-carrier protein] reductase